ncbi:MAG: protein translocase subunit SecD [candidate division Zixibacteria bacterium]|nr:protein translocase subunit SecD [candidate division Zixibacteria bacterium]
MRQSQKVSLIIVAVLVLLSLYGLYPSLVYHSMSHEEQETLKAENPTEYYALKKKSLKLGLDLKGGMHIVLQVQKPEEGKLSDVLDRVLEIIRNRVDKIGVAEPQIQTSGIDRIVVDLPGFTDIEQAKKLIGETAQLQFKLLPTPEVTQALINQIDSILVLVKTDSSDISSKDETEALSDTSMEAIVDIFEEQAPGEDTSAESEEDYYSQHPFMRLVHQNDGTRLVISRTDYYEAQRLLNFPEVQAIIPKDIQLAWATRDFYIGERAYQSLYFLKKQVELSGDHLIDANPTFDQFRRPVVNFELDGAGAKMFSALTGANVDKPLAIVLDDRVESAPVIRSRIRDKGQIELGGNATWDEARLLSVVLKAGALPAKVDIIQNSVIGPSLGQDSINKGKKASLIGLLLVIALMLFYYRISGLIADFALLLNFLFILGFMIIPGINATLTLPGIAGIILTMGISVDSNVLIFERIREELRTGKTVRAAIDAGYSRALLTIVDSHVTTLITALFLFMFGTGPIKGFAVTLSVGVSLSLFTALFVTKIIFNMRKKYKALSI